MAFTNRATRKEPSGRDSKDTARLRKEYEDLARQSRESSDAGSRAALRDKKAKAFERVKEQITGERQEELAVMHKVLIKQGKLLSEDDYQRRLEAHRQATQARANRE